MEILNTQNTSQTRYFYYMKSCSLFVIVFSILQMISSCSSKNQSVSKGSTNVSGIAVLLVDTDHPMNSIDKNIYGHVLEHINHSVADGLYAEQVMGLQ